VKISVFHTAIRTTFGASLLYATLSLNAGEPFQYGETNVPSEVVTTLPSVIVYATRDGDFAMTRPASVRVFDSAEIKRSCVRDLPELLEKKANVSVRTLNANPFQAHVAMRGFGEYSFGRIRILMDGEDIATADMEAPNLVRLPLDAIERVEVIPGPCTVLYGDGAIAGVISVSSDTHDYMHKTRLSVRGGSYGRFGASVMTRGGFEDEGLRYTASYDYSRANGYRNRSGYDLHTFAAGLRKNFANESSVGLRTHYFNGRYEMPGALSESQWRRDSRKAAYSDDDCRQWGYGFATDAKLRLADDQWLYVDGGFGHKHRRSHWGDYCAIDNYSNLSVQFSPRYVNELSIGSHANKMTVGSDFRYDAYDVQSRSPAFDERECFARLRYALFSQEEYFLTERLSVTAGIRGEAIDNRWRTYRVLSETHSRDLQGDLELALVYRPAEELKTYVKGTRFHRSAFCDELNYAADGAFLKPETGVSLDVGAEHAFASEWRAEVSGYVTRMEDEIFFDPHFGRTGYNRNSSDPTQRLGFDAALGWDREKTAEFSIRYAYVDARFSDGAYDGSRVPLVPQSRVRTEVGVWLGDQVELVGGHRFVSTQVMAGDFENAHGRMEAHSLFDVSLRYEPIWAEGLRLCLVIDNLLDANYCDYARWSDAAGASYYPASGRSLQVTLAFAF